MLITFEIPPGKPYFLATWAGKITDDEMLTAYREFRDSGLWPAGAHELADLTAAEDWLVEVD